MSRRHNDANVLCLPADLVGDALMQSIVKVWLQTEFEGGRHQRRVDKILAYERGRERPEEAAAGGPAGETPASGVAQSNSGPIGCRPT